MFYLTWCSQIVGSVGTLIFLEIFPWGLARNAVIKRSRSSHSSVDEKDMLLFIPGRSWTISPIMTSVCLSPILRTLVELVLQLLFPIFLVMSRLEWSHCMNNYLLLRLPSYGTVSLNMSKGLPLLRHLKVRLEISSTRYQICHHQPAILE